MGVAPIACDQWITMAVPEKTTSSRRACKNSAAGSTLRWTVPQSYVFARNAMVRGERSFEFITCAIGVWPISATRFCIAASACSPCLTVFIEASFRSTIPNSRVNPPEAYRVDKDGATEYRLARAENQDG